ncbi:MAG: hypothetical protein KKC80_01685 [Candidatus Margulisbacteria bacterium]|nr:hypothetical protein [Candidatus Margulisiibacteriota bacterium]MBU1617589.1 hypothetical protein [Candidatus Margulisiibacteriota bacterium]
MSIKNKVILTVVFAFFFFYFATDLVANKTVFDRFTKLERDYALNDIGRILYIINDTYAQFGEIIKDWALWDDTYEFAASGSRAYVRSNLSLGTYQSLNLDFMLFCDNGGKPLYAMEVGADGKLKPLPAEKVNDLVKKFLCSPEESHKQGVSLLPGGAFFVVSNQILRSDGSGPGRGTLVMGRSLGSDLINRLISITHLFTSVHLLNDPSLAPEIAAVLPELGRSPIFLKAPNKDKLIGYLLINDISRKPAVVFQVEIPRILNFQAEMFSGLLSLVRLGAFFLCGLAVLLLIQRFVVLPASETNSILDEIKTRCQIKINGGKPLIDEIARIKKSAATILDELKIRSPDK